MPYRTLKDRFLSKVKILPNGCWIWNGARDGNGYGHFGKDGRVQLAHRVSYELFIGPIPLRKYIYHHCDNPSCICPEHLFPGSAIDNAQDAAKKGHMSHSKIHKLMT